MAGEGPPLEVENPATEETVATVGAPSAEQLDAALAAAREAAPGWAATPAVERAELLQEVAARLRARTDELARVMTLEGGKPLIENSDEVSWTAAAFSYYAWACRSWPTSAWTAWPSPARWPPGSVSPGRARSASRA